MSTLDEFAATLPVVGGCKTCALPVEILDQIEANAGRPPKHRHSRSKIIEWLRSEGHADVTINSLKNHLTNGH